MDISEILNTITFEGNIFFKANIKGIQYIKLTPCYDVEHGIVLKAITPGINDVTLDKKWLKLEYSKANELFRINCPSFLKQYHGSRVVVYEDCYDSTNELCRIRREKSDFSKIKHLVKIPKSIKYKPFFSNNARLHISLSYVRNNFPSSVKNNPYIMVSLIDKNVINHNIVVSIFSGSDLRKGELAFKLKRYEHELATPPIRILQKHLNNRIQNFIYQKYEWAKDMLLIHLREEFIIERRNKRTRRRVSSLRKRAQRARRQGDANRGAEAEYRRQKRIVNFKRK